MILIFSFPWLDPEVPRKKPLASSKSLLLVGVCLVHREWLMYVFSHKWLGGSFGFVDEEACSASSDGALRPTHCLSLQAEH